ncbi:MAG: acyltransferase family protein [Enterococcus sp.]
MEQKKRLKKSRYITGFDGIRTLAVVGVILYHLMPHKLKGGYLGVPIFFAVSGYLITDLLRQEWEQNGTINIKDFYVRRMKRLYPGLIGVLVSSTIYMTLFQRDALNNLRGEFFSSITYVNNWWQIHHGFSYFDNFGTTSPFTHIWSLAVEAQNYLVWPLLFLLMMRFAKKQKQFLYVMLGGVVVSAALMMILYEPGGDPTRVYYGTDTRIFTIWMGSALALVWPSTRLKKEIPQQAKNILNGVGAFTFLMLVLSFFIMDDQLTFVYYGGMFLISLLSTIFIAIVAHPGAIWNRLLTNPVFSYLGTRSYSIYLYQFPIMAFYEAKVKNIAENVWLHVVIELTLILVASELSYRLLETPLRKFDYAQTWPTLKRLFGRPFLDKKRPWIIPSVLLTLVFLTGMVIAPKNHIDAQQQKFQDEIAANRKVAEKTKASKEKTTDSEELTRQATVAETYDLSEKQVQEASELEVTMFGDSVMLGATSSLTEVFSQAVVDAEINRQVYTSNELIQNLADEDKLYDPVVIGLGTNGDFSTSQFAELMDTLGKRQVYWINMRSPSTRWQETVNATLAALEDDYDNLTIIDWYDYSAGQTDWFYDDGTHLTETGQIAYTKLIADTLLD